MKSLLSQLQKKKYILTSVIAILLGTSLLQGQTSNNVDIGLGGGLSYGGLGAQLNYRPIEKLAVFGGLGYNLDALGYNLGLKFHLPSEKRLSAIPNR